MGAAQRRLGLPLNSWWQKSDQELANPTKVLELYESYQAMMRTAAWKHYVGLLSSVETDLREKVLNGMLHPQTNEDLTPVLRMTQHLMMQVIALPERIARMKAEDERDILGLVEDKPEPPLTSEEEESLRREMIGA